jgi:glycosyltransferase involved in cell wall biosynthesis
MHVVLVTHEASRTGAPRVAMLVARTLVADGHSVQIVSRGTGPLLGEFEGVAPTSREPFIRLRNRLRSWKATQGLAYLSDTLLTTATLLRRRPDLVYVNSTSASAYLRPARWLRCRVVLHVHESGAVAARFLRTSRSRRLPRDVTVVACSPSVQTELTAIAGRPSAEINLVPSVPDDAEVLRLSELPPDQPYSSDELVVGCCGTVEHRKGVDLWIECAKNVREAMPNRQVRFVWVGDVSESTLKEPVPGIDFVGPSSNPYAHMRRFDVATLPSRDDPFPLVVLEAMMVGTPMVAFGVGGVAQQLGDAGVVVSPGDVQTFANEVIKLLDNRAERERLGAKATSRVKTLYSTAAFARSITDLVERGHVP